MQGLKAAGITLSPGLKKICDEYARDVLGSRKYAPWLYVYSVIRGNFESGWMPDNYYGWFVKNKRNGAYGGTSTLRALSSSVFRTDAVPDVAYFVNGRFFATDLRLIDGEDVPRELFRDSEEIVFKADSSAQGRGIRFIRRRDFDQALVASLGDGVFQAPVQQHEALEAFGSTAVTTLRLTTVIDELGRASLRSAYLRIGRRGETHLQVASLIRVAVDMTTGELSPVGYPQDWKARETHPDSGKTFAENVVPSFPACAELALELHARLPFVQSIGWDLAIDRQGNVRVLEWNGGHNDIKFSEATQGPCFADLGWEDLWRQ